MSPLGNILPKNTTYEDMIYSDVFKGGPLKLSTVYENILWCLFLWVCDWNVTQNHLVFLGLINWERKDDADERMKMWLSQKFGG